MAPNRFRRDVREKRESTPFAEDPATTSDPPEIPAEWRDIEAPINFTWVCQDELAGMGWPKSRDQVRFLVEQGIDHLITLSMDKLPPHYAFPDLKWTSIPVEDFTGPTITEIKKFISIMDDARRDGEVTNDFYCLYNYSIVCGMSQHEYNYIRLKVKKNYSICTLFCNGTSTIMPWKHLSRIFIAL